MDLRKTSDEQKLTLCRKYFYIGFFCLPFLWLVNSIWFFSNAFRRESFPNQKQIRSYVTYSMIGCALWIIAIISWITTFQVKRADWDELGDILSFNIPRGIP